MQSKSPILYLKLKIDFIFQIMLPGIYLLVVLGTLVNWIGKKNLNLSRLDGILRGQPEKQREFLQVCHFNQLLLSL